MKKISILLCLFMGMLLCLSVPHNAKAAYYGIYDIRDNLGDQPQVWPETVHFDWVNRTYTYNSTGDTFSISVKMYAPDNWDTGNPGDTGGIDYNNYQVEDGGYVTELRFAGTIGAFDDVYSYFYQIENQSSTAITSLTIPYDPASVEGYGYFNGTGTNVDSMQSINGDTQLQIDFGSGLDNAETSDWFFMTSRYWWGWQPLTYNGSSSATGQTPMGNTLSPNGMIPAPNPEAPTVALYVVGILGMIGMVRMRLRQRDGIL